MRPYVVKAAYDADGREVLTNTPQVLRRAITPAVAHTMNQVLRGVVNGREGTAHLARVADFTIGGKTGTAQMVDPATRTYYRNRLVASFVGFVPAEDPKLVILVVLYNVPHGHFGGLVAAPVFSEIASDALQQMAVAPAYPPVEHASLLPVNVPDFFLHRKTKLIVPGWMMLVTARLPLLAQTTRWNLQVAKLTRTAYISRIFAASV